MKYREIVDGIFLDHPNRFIAYVDVNGAVETVHVKNTGRCKELLLPGAAVRLEVSDNPKRKTKLSTRRTGTFCRAAAPAVLSIRRQGSRS